MPANRQSPEVQTCINNHPDEPGRIVLSDQSDLDTISPSVKAHIQEARFIAAVTGAGVSRASGLPLLEDEVCGVHLKEFFRGRLLREEPERFYKVYREMLQTWGQVEPNDGHFALAKRGVWVITQNIDGLHRIAGSRHLVELHGNFRELKCESCGAIESSGRALSQTIPTCPRCNSRLVPGIVMEGGEVRHVSLAMDWVGRAEVLLIVGTTMSSDPVRRIPLATNREAVVIEINNHSEEILPKLLQTQFH